ncbi:ribonuclease H protein, partial [Trifolium medium]|nr:ribonuclease H protein [Trifolium medium]
MQCRDKHLVQIKWKAPREGWVKLNMDGASKGRNVSGCCGLIRGVDAEWLGGFSKRIGSANAYIAELWRVLLGLQLSYDRGFKAVQVCVDFEVIIKNILEKRAVNAAGWRQVQKIRQLLDREWE